jgi:hypothetical protein
MPQASPGSAILRKRSSRVQRGGGYSAFSTEDFADEFREPYTSRRISESKKALFSRRRRRLRPDQFRRITGREDETNLETKSLGLEAISAALTEIEAPVARSTPKKSDTHA